jgi:hypothetical protein
LKAGLLSIAGDLEIKLSRKLKTLSGLDQLNLIGGQLYIYSCDSLVNLSGLGNVTSVGGDLELISNDALENLTGLESLNSIGGRLSISQNQSLQNIQGLGNIEPVSITEIRITNNSSLISCNTQSVCNFLSDPAGTVDIYNNAAGCNNPPEIAESCGILLGCLPYGNYYFTTPIRCQIYQDWKGSFR